MHLITGAVLPGRARDFRHESLARCQPRLDVHAVAQEDRFRLRADDGRGLLFTLHRRANAGATDISELVETGQRVRVRFEGIPDVSALAHRLDRL